MTTVSELIEYLTQLPGDARVLIQKDEEGNGYKQTYGAEIAYSEDPKAWEPEEVYSEGDVSPDDYTEVVVIY